jgi:hypothetical protein
VQWVQNQEAPSKVKVGSGVRSMMLDYFAIWRKFNENCTYHAPGPPDLAEVAITLFTSAQERSNASD